MPTILKTLFPPEMSWEEYKKREKSSLLLLNMAYRNRVFERWSPFRIIC